MHISYKILWYISNVYLEWQSEGSLNYIKYQIYKTKKAFLAYFILYSQDRIQTKFLYFVLFLILKIISLNTYGMQSFLSEEENFCRSQ